MQRYDLSQCEWSLTGYAPNTWRMTGSVELDEHITPEVPTVPAAVPGSVQKALLVAGVIPDWNVGLDSRACEWVENRDWVFTARLEEEWIEPGCDVRLRCEGLDGFGSVRINGRDAGQFKNAFVPHEFDLTPYVGEGVDVLHIVFQASELPRWLSTGYTSRITEWKPRFNYTWDWTSRIVQLGVWDGITLEVGRGPRIETLRCTTHVDLDSGRGRVKVAAALAEHSGCSVRLEVLNGSDAVLACREIPAGRLAADGADLEDLQVELWHPNGRGAQPLYTVSCVLVDPEGREADRHEKCVGFKHVEWRANDGAPDGADPWICVVNGVEVFLQGVNWTPIRPNFADVTRDDVRKRVEVYRDMGCNVLRVWGGAVLEREDFYDLCDRAGLMVWQEFPLSSSGIDNWPPESPRAIDDMADTARTYITRRQHHASLLLWCGGNELQGSLDGRKEGTGKPVDATHPLLARLKGVVEEEDPSRRYLPTSSSGPRFRADEREFGKGLHWDVHGPWNIVGESYEDTERYWRGDDALFRSETGFPGASDARIIRRYAGDLPLVPGTVDNPLFRRTSGWIDWPLFVKERGREPADLEEYVEWSQARQAKFLQLAARSCKARFPACGGIILWMGHDSFPCTGNTAVVGFDGDPKPAAQAVGAVFREGPDAG